MLGESIGGMERCTEGSGVQRWVDRGIGILDFVLQVLGATPHSWALATCCIGLIDTGREIRRDEAHHEVIKVHLFVCILFTARCGQDDQRRARLQQFWPAPPD